MPREIEPADDSRQILCERCRKFVAISGIKYIPRGNESRIALCTSCLAKFNGEAEATKKKIALEKMNSEKPSYFCSRCRYKFKFDTTKKPTLRCPYCGKSDRLTEDKYTTAASILKEASDF